MVEYKGYYIKPNKETPNVYQVVTTGQGGKIPTVLEGMFTSRSLAMFVIDKYVDQKEEAKVNDKKLVKRGV
jgi:hypothetical protein